MVDSIETPMESILIYCEALHISNIVEYTYIIYIIYTYLYVYVLWRVIWMNFVGMPPNNLSQNLELP